MRYGHFSLQTQTLLKIYPLANAAYRHQPIGNYITDCAIVDPAARLLKVPEISFANCRINSNKEVQTESEA